MGLGAEIKVQLSLLDMEKSLSVLLTTFIIIINHIEYINLTGLESFVLQQLFSFI